MDEIKQLRDEFVSCQELLTALGDETRLYIIIQMIQISSGKGLRVGEIAKQAHLSRPAISHHLKILKDAKVLKVHKEGTKNYYYFDIDMKSFTKLIDTLEHAKQIASKAPKLYKNED